MSYTLVSKSSHQIKIKRSEFISICFPVSRGKEISLNLKDLRKKYPQSSHICWAYRIYNQLSIVENSSDAGEPSGTAGIPILNQIRKADLINTACFVIRKFGGIKLGKRGLVEIYSLSAKLVLDSAEAVLWIPKCHMEISCRTQYIGLLSHLVNKFNGKIISDMSTENLKWVIELPLEDESSFLTQIKNTGKKVIIQKKSEHDQTKEGEEDFGRSS